MTSRETLSPARPSAEQLGPFGAAWRRQRLALLPLSLAEPALLAAAGLPLALVAGVLVLQLVKMWQLARIRADDPARLFAARVVLVLANGAMVILTGGLRSPLVPALVGPALGGVVLFGRSRRSAFVLAAAVAVAAAGMLTHGPEVREPYFAILFFVAFAKALLQAWRSVSVIAEIQARSAAALERMRLALLEEAQGRAAALEMRGARLGHELKNPLTSVKALVQLLARQPADERSAGRFDVLLREVGRMERLLRGYLALSRPEAELERERLSLRALLQDVVSALDGPATAGRVALRQVGADAQVDGDARRLRDALINLTANAVEATDPGGSVEIVLESSGGEVSILIRDSGRGIAPDVLAGLGRPFFTTRTEGTGLGVTLARSWIEQHGGKLSITSVEGRGTTATVRLPAAAAESLLVTA